MRYGRMFAGLAVATVLGLPQVVAANTTGNDDGTPLGPPGVERPAPCAKQPSGVAATDEDANPSRLVGEVIAIDQGAGVAMLSTERGVVAVHGTPEMLAQIGVGDLVVVETASPNEGDGAASPREPSGDAVSPQQPGDGPARSPSERCL